MTNDTLIEKLRFAAYGQSDQSLRSLLQGAAERLARLDNLAQTVADAGSSDYRTHELAELAQAVLDNLN